MTFSLFAKNAATESRLLARSCESLIGICAGMMADCKLQDEEIHFLDTWLKDNDHIAMTWPGEVLVKRVRSVLADGVIAAEERLDLETTLRQLLGGSALETGATNGTAARLPVDETVRVAIAGKSFCFTGEFLYGTRSACERAVKQHAGDVAPGIRIDLDYLVIGTMASREWAHTTHGRKIDKALEYKAQGHAISIVAEDQWVCALTAPT
jgi:NAD-dependent DNA ligase